jgi:flagellar basal body-associated protein FliL
MTHTVVVDMLIEYDLNNNAAATELTGRVNQLRDFTRNYFSGKHYTELEPENEAKLKQEIREILNTSYLDTAKVRGVLFNKLDIMEI